MPFLQHGAARIHYRDEGQGTPLLILPGGGLNATMAFYTGSSPFDAMAVFRDRYRCITLDLRNAPAGQSTGPVEAERPWDSHADDQLALMDHLGCDRFLVMGFCIGGPFIWNLLRRAPERVIAAVLAQPSGARPDMPGLFFANNMKGWAPALCAARPDVSMAEAEAFLRRMYLSRDDFVFTVTREFVAGCQTPVLVLPDDIPPHPYEVAMESARLAPNAQVSLYPWKNPPELVPLALRHIGDFLAVNGARG